MIASLLLRALVLCVTAERDLWYSVSWIIMYNSFVVTGNTDENAVFESWEGMTEKGREDGKNKVIEKGKEERRSREQVWQRKAQSEESFFQVVCSQEATLDWDGLRLNSQVGTECASISTHLYFLYPDRLKTKEQKPVWDQAMLTSHVEKWSCAQQWVQTNV